MERRLRSQKGLWCRTKVGRSMDLRSRVAQAKALLGNLSRLHLRQQRPQIGAVGTGEKFSASVNVANAIYATAAARLTRHLLRRRDQRLRLGELRVEALNFSIPPISQRFARSSIA